MTTVISRDVYGKEYTANAENLKTSVHVYGLAIQDGKILISPQFDGFDFPGGTAEKGETHLETLVRELREETGYTVAPVRLLAVYTSFFHHYKTGQDYQSYMIYYQVKITGGELSDAGFDTNEKEYASLAKWVDLKDLKTMHHACSIDILGDLLTKLEKPEA